MSTIPHPLREEPRARDFAMISHSRRVAALATEIGRMAGVSASMQPMLQQAARVHHSLEMTKYLTPLGRLARNIVCGTESHDGALGDPPQFHAAAGIVRLCNLVDEQFEWLEFEPKDVDTILDEIQSLAPIDGFDPALVDHFRRMRCRGLIERIMRGDGLPVEVGAARQIFGALALEREYEVRELGALALRDPVLAASLIRVANSCSYSPSSKFSEVCKAIAYMGTVEARKVLLAAVVRPMFASAGLTRLWSHSVEAAQFCTAMAKLTEIMGADEALLLGLVHDFGALAIQFAPRETRDLYARLVEQGCPATYVERLLFGCDHGEIGAQILAQWHFPIHLIEAVRFHHQPERSDCSLASFLYLAEVWSGRDEDLPAFHRVEDCLKRTGISPASLMQTGAKESALNTLRSVA